MSLQDFFYLTISIGFILLVIFISLMSFFLIRLLISLKLFMDKLDDTAKGVRIIKDNLKLGILSVATAAAIALSDKKNRKMAENFLKDLKVRGEKGLEELQKEARKFQNKVALESGKLKQIKGKK